MEKRKTIYSMYPMAITCNSRNKNNTRNYALYSPLTIFSLISGPRDCCLLRRRRQPAHRIKEPRHATQVIVNL